MNPFLAPVDPASSPPLDTMSKLLILGIALGGALVILGELILRGVLR